MLQQYAQRFDTLAVVALAADVDAAGCVGDANVTAQIGGNRFGCRGHGTPDGHRACLNDGHLWFMVVDVVDDIRR